MTEQTFVMLKPDAVQRGLIGEIIGRIERKGYRIIAAKMMMLDEAILREHYAHLAAEPFFPDTLAFMMSGPVLAMIVSGEDAVAGVRRLMGATRLADALPGTIRGDLATSTGGNVIHGSDCPAAAEVEIHRFFG